MASTSSADAAWNMTKDGGWSPDSFTRFVEWAMSGREPLGCLWIGYALARHFEDLEGKVDCDALRQCWDAGLDLNKLRQWLRTNLPDGARLIPAKEMHRVCLGINFAVRYGKAPRFVSCGGGRASEGGLGRNAADASKRRSTAARHSQPCG